MPSKILTNRKKKSRFNYRDNCWIAVYLSQQPFHLYKYHLANSSRFVDIMIKTNIKISCKSKLFNAHILRPTNDILGIKSPTVHAYWFQWVSFGGDCDVCPRFFKQDNPNHQILPSKAKINKQTKKLKFVIRVSNGKSMIERYNSGWFYWWKWQYQLIFQGCVNIRSPYTRYWHL